MEEVACPLIEERKAGAGKATLGTAIGQLTSAVAEAEAAVHLAVLLVQGMSAGVLRRTPSS